MPFKKWPSIDKFSDVYFSAQRNQINEVTVRGKIKLHGTSAAIRVEGGQFVGQKRTSDVSIGDDNAGFAAWVAKLEPAGDGVFTQDFFEEVYFYGEWAGPGVQKTDAIASIPCKKFFIFAVLDAVTNTITFDPVLIAAEVDHFFKDHPDMIVLPWYTEPQVVRMMDQADAQKFITGATTLVDEVVSVCDPFVKEMFDVEGPGEGIVYYAIDQPAFWDQWMFKVKSDAHTVNKSKVRDHVAPEKPEGIDDFIDAFFTVGRLEQMLNDHFGGVADRKNTGDFIRVVMQDAHKESVNEIELADFEWADVAKYAVLKVRVWFFDQAAKL